MIDFYKQSDLLRVINGEASIPEISNEIRALIDGIKGWLSKIRPYTHAGN